MFGLSSAGDRKKKLPIFILPNAAPTGINSDHSGCANVGNGLSPSAKVIPQPAVDAVPVVSFSLYGL